MFCIGDRVSYPMHGAAVIESIEEREHHGEKSYYYVLRFAVGGMKVMVPVENVEGVGLRDIISRQDYEGVLRRLSRQDTDPQTNWNKRYRDNLEKMRSGNIYDVADVVRTLTLRDREKGLSTGERKMLANARQILLSELVLASGKGEEEIADIVDEVIATV